MRTLSKHVRAGCAGPTSNTQIFPRLMKSLAGRSDALDLPISVPMSFIGNIRSGIVPVVGMSRR